MQEIEQKQIWGGKSSALVTINSTLCVRCDIRAEFSTAAAPLVLARGYNGQAPENCSCFLPLSLLNWLLNAFFQKLEFTLWLVKLKQIRGQVRNTLHISQKRLSLFFPDFTHLFLLYPKAVPSIDQLRSYTVKGVNLALHFPTLKLHLARLHSPREVWLCEHMTIFQTNS